MKAKKGGGYLGAADNFTTENALEDKTEGRAYFWNFNVEIILRLRSWNIPGCGNIRYNPCGTSSFNWDCALSSAG